MSENIENTTQETSLGTDPISVDQSGVELDSLQKTFGKTVAVDGVNLDIERGELLVLLGPSGCGKSTTLRMIAGLEIPDSGTISINGNDVTNELPKDRDISMVFQNYALYPHKDVRGNLRFPLGKMELTEDEKEEKVQEAAELLDIVDILDKEPSQLSGGQQQRVALGRTIVREPKVFLMDEPLSNLDAKLRVKTRSEIRSLQQTLGTTTVYVTHDQEEAMSIADRIVVMNEGELVQVGTPRELYNKPKNEFVANFIGSPAMNLFSASALESPPEWMSPRTSTVGVRPENLEQGGARAGENDLTIPDCQVLLVQPLGDEFEVTLSVRGAEFKAILPKISSGIGDKITVSASQSDIHMFNNDNEAIR